MLQCAIVHVCTYAYACSTLISCCRAPSVLITYMASVFTVAVFNIMVSMKMYVSVSVSYAVFVHTIGRVHYGITSLHVSDHLHTFTFLLRYWSPITWVRHSGVCHSGGPPFRGSGLGLGLGLTLADLWNGGPLEYRTGIFFFTPAGTWGLDTMMPIACVLCLRSGLAPWCPSELFSFRPSTHNYNLLWGSS